MQRTKDILRFVAATVNKSAKLFENGIIRTYLLKIPKLTATTGAINLTFAAATDIISRGAGSFITDGFEEGMIITTDATEVANQGPLTIVSVSALEIAVSEALTDEGPAVKTATATTATLVTQIDVIDEEGDTVYTDATNRSEDTTHLITGLTIPIDKNYTFKMTLDAACGSDREITLKTFIETMR